VNDTTARLKSIEAQIEASALEAGRNVSDITLIAVSKTFPAEAIVPVLEAGHREFGENRVQEAAAKWPDLREKFPGTRLHLIGALQSNKAREAVELFDVIHTLDRDSLAVALQREIARTGLRPELFVQVNTGLEPQKSGIAPAETLAFVARCRETLALPVVGLMCLPPEDEEPSVHFAMLARLAKECGLPKLSMGMSGDFHTAIGFGATHVRVGSAIFGSRPPH
jgi:PLP dependent protein